MTQVQPDAVEAEFTRRDRVARRRARIAGVLTVGSVLTGGYFLFGLPNGGNTKGCGPRPSPPSSSEDFQAILATAGYVECERSVAQALPPVTVFRGRLDRAARDVADAYVRAEYVARSCRAAERLFYRVAIHGARNIYAPECGPDDAEYESTAGDFVVSKAPTLQHHCADAGYYRLRASQCYVYPFIDHTNKLSSSTDSRGRTTHDWEFDVTHQMIWLRLIHGRWRVILESSEGDSQFFVGERGYPAAKDLWDHRMIPGAHTASS